MEKSILGRRCQIVLYLRIIEVNGNNLPKLNDCSNKIPRVKENSFLILLKHSVLSFEEKVVFPLPFLYQ